MKTGEEGEATKVIEVAVGQKNKIKVTSGNLVVAGQGVITRMLGVKTGINRKFKRADNTVRTIRPDSPVWVKISKLHLTRRGCRRIDWDFHSERFHPHMHLAAVLIHPMEGSACFRREMGNMVTVVGKRSPRFQNWAFADNFIALDYGGGAILIDEDPLPTQQSDGGFGEVVDSNKINEGMKVCTLHSRLFLVMD